MSAFDMMGSNSRGTSVATSHLILLNGRQFEIACAPGEGPRLAELVAAVTQRFEALQAEHGAVGEERLLLMTALTLADALADTEAARDRAEQRAIAAEQMVAALQAAHTPKQRAKSTAATATAPPAVEAVAPKSGVSQ